MLVRCRWLLVCAGVGLLSVALGPDNYWDLRYYHLYAPWAYLHGRYLYDIGPAQEQGFLNPTADFLFYGLISSPLNSAPRLIAFIMGAVHRYQCRVPAGDLVAGAAPAGDGAAPYASRCGFRDGRLRRGLRGTCRYRDQ